MADLIDRAALLVALDYGRTHNIGVRQIVNDAPTIDAAPVVHAYWEGHCDEDLNRGDWRICTACGHDEWGKAEDGSNYCPACGARMDADAPERAGKEQNNG